MVRRAAVWMAVLLLVGGCERAESKKSAEELLKAAWGHLRLDEFDQAEEGFSAAIKKAGRDRRLEVNATYGLVLVASLGHRGEQRERAKEMFDRVIELDAPARGEDGKTAAWAALALVRDEQINGGEREALRAAYGAVAEKYAGSDAAEEAFVDRQTLDVAVLSEDAARRAAGEIGDYLGRHPEAHLKVALYALLSKAKERLGDHGGALQASIASVEAKEKQAGTEASNNILEYYRIGMMAQFDVGDFATARKYYEKFLAAYPLDQRAFNVRLMMKNMDETEASLRAGGDPVELTDKLATNEHK